MALQLCVGIAIARVYGPENLGIITLALLTFSGVSLLAEFGTSSALVRTPCPPSLATATRSQIWVATAAALVGAALPPFGVLGEYRSVVPGALLATALAVQVFSVAPIALLRRELHHGQVVAAQIASYGLGYATVLLVMHGSADVPMNISLALLLQASILTAWTLASGSRKVSTRPTGKKTAMPRSPAALVSNICNWVTESGDNLIVGHFLGATSLGLYSRGYQVPRLAADAMVQGAQQVVLPYVSRRLREGREIGDVLALAVLVAVLSGCPFAVLGLNAELIVDVVFGAAYEPAAPVLTALSVAMPFHILTAFTGPVLAGTRGFRAEMVRQSATAVLLVAAVTAACAGTGSLQTAAWAVAGVYAVRGLVLALGAAGTRVFMLASDIWRLVPGLATFCLTMVATEIVLRDSWVALVVEAVAAAVAVLAIARSHPLLRGTVGRLVRP